MDTKICNKCGIEKSVDEFSFRKDTNNYKNTCKQCINKAHRENRLKNLEYYREKDRIYHQEHLDKRKEQSKKSRIKNAEKIKAYKKEYAEKNKEIIAKKMKEYAQNNKEKLKEYHKNYYEQNKNELSLKRKKYREEHKEEIANNRRERYYANIEKNRENDKKRYIRRRDKILKYQKEYREEHREELKEKHKISYEKRKNNPEYLRKKKEYREEHKEELKEYFKEYTKNHREEINNYILNRTKNDSVYALKLRIRKMIYDSFKRRDYQKSTKTTEILGCSIDEFIKHLLNTYKSNYGIEWDGKVKVQIDHIVPLSTAKTEEEVIKLCNYKNLQLLTQVDNREKSDKLDWKLNNIKGEYK